MKNTLPLILICLAFLSNAQSGMLNGTGDAPDITVNDINGNTHNLYNYLDSGYVMVLELLSTTCGHCQSHAIGTENSYLANGPDGTNTARFLGLEVNPSTDSAAVANFSSTYGVGFPIANNISPANINYQLSYTPTYYVIYPDKSYTTICANCITVQNSSTIEGLLNSAIQSWLLPINGCTDSTAINYNPQATIDNGSCSYPCLLNEVSLNLFDSYGDGWSGAFMTVNGIDYSLPTGSVDSFIICIDMSACIDLIYTPGAFFANIENSWNVTDSSGTILAAGPDASGQFGNGCAVSGCTDPNADNYDSSATYDDGNCIYYQTWNQVSNFIASGRHHPITFGNDNFGFVMSGSYLDDVYKYDKANDTWTQLQDIPFSGRGYSYGVSNGDKAYMGFGSTSNNTFPTDWWEYDMNNDSWIQLANFPGDGRQHPAMIVVNDNIYMGCGGNGNGNLGDWWEYNITLDAWTQKSNFIGNNRHHPYYFGLGDYAYVGFGHGSIPATGSNSSYIYKDFYRYDPLNDSWIQLSDFPSEARVAGTQFSYNGKGYILSGDGDNHQPLSSGEFWEYEPNNDSWIQLPPHPGGAIWAPGNFVIGCDVYFLLGQDLNTNMGLYPTSVFKYELCDVDGCTDPSAGNYDPSATVDDGSCTSPSCNEDSPTGLFVDGIIHSRATINWDNMNSATCVVDQYRIKYREVGTTPVTQKTMGAPLGSCTYGNQRTDKQLYNLTGATTYEYQMKAWYCGGGTSAWTAWNTFTTADDLS